MVVCTLLQFAMETMTPLLRWFIIMIYTKEHGEIKSVQMGDWEPSTSEWNITMAVTHEEISKTF